jgi:dihydrofolate synthase/folylpolyglutamate synthase
VNIDSALRLLASRPVGDGSGETLARLLDVLGDPHRAAPTLVVSGPTAAAVAAMATALLRAQGLSVGTVTSTALEQVGERLAWDGAQVDDETLATLVGDVVAVEELAGVEATRSDLVTAAAFRWFAEVAVDVVVLEAGGGAIAALVEPAVAVGTDPDGRAVVVSPDGTWGVDDAYGVAVDKVAVGGRLLDLRTPEAAHDDVYLPIHGAHQAEAAATAVAAVEAFLGRAQATEAVVEALAEVRLPGRFEVVGRHPTVIVDVVTDVEGAAATAATLAEDLTLAGSVLLVVGLRAGPDPSAVLDALGAASAGLVVTCAPEGPGAVAASDLVGVAERLGAVAETVPEPVDAAHRALAVATEDDLVLVAGAPDVVGPVRAALREMETAS